MWKRKNGKATCQKQEGSNLKWKAHREEEKKNQKASDTGEV